MYVFWTMLWLLISNSALPTSSQLGDIGFILSRLSTLVAIGLQKPYAKSDQAQIL
jgi:hypothetical protein